jgi:hypothetical protein
MNISYQETKHQFTTSTEQNFNMKLTQKKKPSTKRNNFYLYGKLKSKKIKEQNDSNKKT